MIKYIGCSGYYYNHWKDVFYPEGLSKKSWLQFYAQHFNTVEINSSFYHLPLDSTLINWYQITPPSFVFTLKGNRYISHLKKLQVDTDMLEILHSFQHKASLLKDKLGCILWQLPKSQGADLVKLERFCKQIDTSIPQIFEFRHPGWYINEVYQMLHHYGCSLCILSSPDHSPQEVHSISDLAYVRFHGINGWYDDNYTNEQLDDWASKIKSLSVSMLYAYFNNDFHGFAVNNGIYFSQILQEY